MKKIFFIILCLIIVSGCSGAKYQIETKINNALEYISKPFINKTETKLESAIDQDQNNDQFSEHQILDSVNLDMVFTSQAPHANWDDLHDEACEEASLVLVHYYLQNESSLSKEQAEKEIQDMVAWQMKEYGGHHDLTISQLAQFTKDYYGYENVQVLSEITIDDIKRELSKGNPIIIPAAGRDLGNPYFTQPGPIYHMLVIKGYNSKYFITNDVGTRRGENFKYKFDTLYNAIHDFVGKSEQEMRKGQKLMLIINN